MIYDVELLEPAPAQVTGDTTLYSADNATWPTADGGVLSAIDVVSLPAVVVEAALSEPIHPGVTADALAPTVDALAPTADGGILLGATDASDAAVNANIVAADIAEAAAAADSLDADVVAAEVPLGPGGIPPWLQKPRPVVGVGYGILAALEGEAHGVVIRAGDGVGALPELAGKAQGAAGVAAQAAGVAPKAVAVATGAVGFAARSANVAILKGLSAAGDGVAITHGKASGTLVKLEASASGRHDDDEAAVMAFLLAA